MTTTTVPINGKTTSAKFFTSIGFAALIAALQAIAALFNADPALAQWGTLVLAVVGALSVWRVPNKMYVDITGDPIDLLNQRIDSLRITGYYRSGDTFVPTPTVVDGDGRTVGQSPTGEATVTTERVE